MKSRTTIDMAHMALVRPIDGYVHNFFSNADDTEPGNSCFPRGVICMFDAYSGLPYLPHVPKSVFVPVVTALYDENGVR